MLTILLVDDDRRILSLCNSVLARIPETHTMEAAGGREALEIAMRHEGVIDLLLSDISMPGELNGVQLAERLVTSRPAIKVLLMSGYSPEDFQLDETWRFLPKPFSPAALLAKVEETMEGKLCGIPAPRVASVAGSAHR